MVWQAHVAVVIITLQSVHDNVGYQSQSPMNALSGNARAGNAFHTPMLYEYCGGFSSFL